MITPELSQYVKDQLAAGVLPGDIRTTLINKGWPVVDVDQVLGGNVPATIDNNQVIILPKAAMSSKGKGLLIAISVLLLVILLCGGVYAAYLYTKNSSSNTNLSKTNSQQTGQSSSPVPTAEIPTSGTTIFQDTGIQFSYDSSWKKIGGSALMAGNFDDSTSSATPETQYLFFNQSNWQTVEKEVSDFKATSSNDSNAFADAIGLLSKINDQSDFSLTRMTKTSAHAAAQQTTQTVCTGSNVDFSTDNPIVESRIQSTTVGKYPAYLILSQNGCDYKSVQVFLDANTSMSSLPTPTPIPGVTVTITGGPTPSGDSFILSFGNASDLQHLSPGQQIILNSLQLP